MPILDTIAKTIGSAVRSYQTALQGPARRPMFLNSMADAEKWQGGDLGAKDAAFKRALQNSWIYTSINYKASELASCKLYVARTSGALEYDAIPVKGHPFTRLLLHPNPLMGRGFLWRYTHWWLDLSGNGYWFLAPDEDGNLSEIWPLPANLVNPFPGNKERLVDYYEYIPNGQMWRIPAEYICHFRYPNPYDYFRGLSPLVAAMLPADSDSAMAHWNGAFFGQGNVMPSAVISLSSGNPQQPIDPQDVEAVKEQLTSDYSASARRTVVTNAFDMSVNVLGWNAKDMDFLAGRSFTKEEILGIYGIPAGLLDKNATEANATTSDNVFKEKTLWPLMNAIYADSITAQILERWYPSPPEQELIAAFVDIRPLDKAQVLQESAATLSDLTRAERRARFWNLPPLGDERDNEIPGAAPAGSPPILGGTEGGFSMTPQAGGLGLPYPKNAAIPAARPLLSLDALSDLRRWKRLALKSLQAGQAPPAQFASAHIPANLKTVITETLQNAGDAEDVKDVFNQWMAGETSTKASPFTRKSDWQSDLQDDPYKPVKRAAESELQTELEQYFAELAERIGEQVDHPDGN
jgi:HK97 family phage portal protein